VFTVLNAALVINNSVGLGIALGHRKKAQQEQGGSKAPSNGGQ